MKSGTIALIVAGMACLGGVAFIVIRNNKQSKSLAQQRLTAAPPVSGVSRGVASGSGVNASNPRQNVGYGDKIFGTASNALGLASDGYGFYKKVIG